MNLLIVLFLSIASVALPIAMVVYMFKKIFGGRKNTSQRDIRRKEKQQRPKKHRREEWDWDYGYDEVEEERFETWGTKSEEDREFYNIKSRDNSSDCPYIYHKSSNGGQEPYYCSLVDCQISSDTYYHLCRYEWSAEERCPYR